MSEDIFSGFMPMINSVNVSELTVMINNDGDLIKAHTIVIETKNGDKHVFSIDNVDLMRLAFLLFKVATHSIE